MGYRLISSKEGIDYLEKNNKSLQDFSKEYYIPSRYGSIYQLSTGEIILILLRGQGEYPGFIFDDYESFKKCCDADFFPIAEKDMTWLELHASQMKSFLIEDSFYMAPLKQELLITVPFKKIEDCEMGYEKLVKYIGSKKNESSAKVTMAHSYALAVTKFLIEEKGYTWELTKKYEIYNPYYYPSISNGENTNVDVITSLFMAIDRPKRPPFREFYWFVTRIPPHEKID